MKKPAQKTTKRLRRLQAEDLAAVSGGDDGVIHVQKLAEGATPNDNGVIHVEK